MAGDTTKARWERDATLPRRERVAATDEPADAPADAPPTIAERQPDGGRDERSSGQSRPSGVPRGRGMRPPRDDGATESRSTDHDYWSADALFSESRRIEAELEVLVEHRTDAELLEELELDPAAEALAIGRAQRQLALRHHPDRWATYATAIIEEHEGKMRRVNQVVAELRSRGRC